MADGASASSQLVGIVGRIETPPALRRTGLLGRVPCRTIFPHNSQNGIVAITSRWGVVVPCGPWGTNSGISPRTPPSPKIQKPQQNCCPNTTVLMSNILRRFVTENTPAVTKPKPSVTKPRYETRAVTKPTYTINERPPVGLQAMSDAERMRKYRDRRRAAVAAS
jgi:hypothetical protein